jgi:hypothetical protein
MVLTRVLDDVLDARIRDAVGRLDGRISTPKTIVTKPVG